ncbi:MAG: helix-turn-helix transcriptional regulator [Planctomycetes bacterium]|nr:helix-turn-helix transcriptional regulator [Planctomycetota bacterium]
MAENKRYNKVSDMMTDVLGDEDPGFVEELKTQIQRRKLVRGLSSLRNMKGISQKEVADAAGCAQSRISKMENGCDEQVRLGDIEAYAKALGCEVEVVLRSNDFTIVEEVKYLAFRIERCFNKLVTLVKSDEDVAQGVAEFHVEALLNLAHLVLKSQKRLPKREGSEHATLTIPEVILSEREKAVS